MKQKPPAFQFYPKQWLGDDKVMLMDWDARGMHLHLMCISWQQSPPGTIPNDESVIRRWLKEPSQKVWVRVWPQIKSAWKIWGKNSDFLYSRGVLREYRKIKAFSRKQQKNAKQLWDHRRSHGMSLAYAKTMPRHDSGNARAGNALQSSTAVLNVPYIPPSGTPASPRANGTSPRAKGTNPRALGINPRALKSKAIQEMAKARAYKDPVIPPSEEMSVDEMKAIRQANLGEK